MVSKTGFKIIRIMAATAVALMLMAIPVFASPAVTNFSMDRSTITNGQSITFSVTTSSQTQFVFAVVDGVRTQGLRTTTNNWSVTVYPTRTTTITIYANSTNSETNAVSISIPVTVTGTTPNTNTTLPAVTIPPAPANLGAVAIASITETPARASGEVQLTVVTGIETNEVWVNFDRENNARGTGRFARGTMLSQGNNHRIWVINFRPTSYTTQRVEVGSNRTYNWPGAATQTYDLTLSQPYVAPVNPIIQSVTASTRNVTTNGNVTFTIRTNADVEHVWVRTVDGREHNASRSSSTSTSRTWTVTFSPSRSGNVTVFANATRTEEGAASRNENITVGTFTATIVGTPTATSLGNSYTRINVTTNQYAETVWAVFSGSSTRVQLNRTDNGTGNRSWSIDTYDSNASGSITIYVTSQTGTLNNLTADNSMNITRTGSTGSLTISPGRTQLIAPRGGSQAFTVYATNATVTDIFAYSLTNDFYVSSSYTSGGVGYIVVQSINGNTATSGTITLTVMLSTGQTITDTITVYTN